MATQPVGISPTGSIAGSYEDTVARHGFVRDPEGKFTIFDPPQSAETLPTSVNGAGAVTGSSVVNNNLYGFVRDPQGAIVSFDPGPCGHGRRKFPRTGEKSAFFRFRQSAIVWSREPSSSSWSRSSKLISKRGRMDTGRDGQRTKR
jgi:hypothetical protein